MSVPADPSRVYVGNVNFNATEAELKELFEDFNVVSVEIPFKTITRGEKTFQRRLGFGFVQFENETDANNAISQFNGKKFKQRQIYAKKALPPATEEEKQKKRELFIAKQAQLKEKKRDSKQAELPTQATEKDGTIELSTEKTTSTGHVNKTPEGKKSTDTIFVTNLDFKANVKSLNELFKDLNPIWVNVPTKRVPFHVLKKFSATRKAIYNKGIAFVKFADEATQLQAIKEFNGKEINGRKIVVEVAVDKPVSSETSSSDSTASPDAVISGELNED
ncbi:hypothetical protein JCM33374_g3969 [Metschnikowia sp. JCM 33374]|nr:hypothetical protein JCM33374_g3969 [Metschnikowia sp. JCM 33374]